VVIPAAAFYGGLADLLASALATQGGTGGGIDEITVAIALDHWWPTEGTRKTGERNKAPRMVVKDGRLAPLAPSAEVPDWAFSAPLGRQAMLEMPFSEVITLAHHLKVGEIRSLLNRSALADIRDASTPPPTAADDRGRSAQRFELVVRLVQGGVTRTAGVRGSRPASAGTGLPPQRRTRGGGGGGSGGPALFAARPRAGGVRRRNRPGTSVLTALPGR
jgi:hypothetical protein